MIIYEDRRRRIDFKLSYGDLALKCLPKIVYIIEESNIIFDSYSLRRKDLASDTFNKFISIDRNLGLSSIFVCTRLRELSTSIRERSKILVGKILGESDLNMIKKVTSKRTMNLARDAIRKYHFIYDEEIFRLKDECVNQPIQYVSSRRGRADTSKRDRLIGQLIGLGLVLGIMYFIVSL